MDVFNTVSALAERIRYEKLSQHSIGFVPTMGALHAGHISLIRRAKGENSIAVCSIFVNPTQFNNPEDLEKYPRTLQADAMLLEQAGCDILFAPSAAEIYPDSPGITLNFGILETVMEGRFRPGHFNGVGLVVAKLFHMVQPDRAYFGLKDLQQVAVVKQLIRDFNFPITLVPCATLRELDGLAMSSRNTRLSENSRPLAAHVFRSLEIGSHHLLEGKSAAETKDLISEYFSKIPEIQLEYYEICQFETLEPIAQHYRGMQTAICTAVFLEGVRLIDNIVF